MEVKFEDCGCFPSRTGRGNDFSGDVRSYPLLLGLSSFTCRTELPEREQSCPTDLIVLRTSVWN